MGVMIFKLIPIFILGLAPICLAADLTLTISDGKVKGTQKSTYLGNKYYAFYSIRYAQPPIGPLRFQAPVPVQPWSGVFDATKQGNICYQVAVDSNDEGEDCVSLNVYTPKNPNSISTKLPVVFHVHGGGFIFGSGQTKNATGDIEPGNFMDLGSVVIVAINTRLGPFGYLRSGDSIIPGNAGLKDILLALKWVQKNIATFGGDPAKVTLFGETSGGSSVGYLLMNPAATGLYNAAIILAGTPLSPWAYQRNQTEISFKTASFIYPQFETDRDSQKLLNYMQNASGKDIDKASKSYSDWVQSYNDSSYNAVANAQLQQGFYYAPSIEPDNCSPILTEKPYEAFANGHFNKVPLLIGTTADEGLLRYAENLQRFLAVYDEDHSLLVSPSLHITDPKTKKAIGDAIKQEYSPNSRMQDNLLSGIQYFRDNGFHRPVIRFAELYSKYSDVFFFKFSYSGPMGLNTKQRYPGTTNVTHNEAASYIWQKSNPKIYPQADQLVQKRLLKIFLNFIIYHNPTPSKDATLQNIIWPKLKEGNLQYVDIEANLTVKTNPSDKYTFWKNLFQKYGKEPFETY